jgi:hypothetical protein
MRQIVKQTDKDSAKKPSHLDYLLELFQSKKKKLEKRRNANFMLNKSYLEVVSL